LATKAPAKKTRVTKAQVTAHRTKAAKDHSPVWDNVEQMDASQFLRHWHGAMNYYRFEFSGKDLKPAVIKWMTTIGCTKEDIQSFKKTKDNRCSLTMGSIASCLLRGMPAVRADFNDGKDTTAWLRNAINEVIAQGKDDIDEDEAPKEVKAVVYTPTIQERVREAAMRMTEEIENAFESFQTDPENFDPKLFKVLNLLKAVEAKAAHTRIIKEFYSSQLAELEELASGNGDEQLKEGYSHRSKKQIKAFIAFLQEVDSACIMLGQESKINRKPRKTKVVPKDKIVAKLKFKKSDEPLKLVSINPTDIIGASELWIFNTKTRKLGKYVAAEFNTLNVKGTTITNFDEFKSVQKTLRKPVEQLKAFKDAGKVALRKFLEDINAVDTKMNGRLNEETLLLKVA
jgi:hypothetical protein